MSAPNLTTAVPEFPDPLAPARLGPITLRNRVIKSATFEGVTPNALVSDRLVDFHVAVGAGGVGMTTVAYLAVAPPEVAPSATRSTGGRRRSTACGDSRTRPRDGRQSLCTDRPCRSGRQFPIERFAFPRTLRQAQPAVDELRPESERPRHPPDRRRPRPGHPLRPRGRIRRRRDPPRTQLSRQLVPEPPKSTAAKIDGGAVPWPTGPNSPAASSPRSRRPPTVKSRCSPR